MSDFHRGTIAIPKLESMMPLGSVHGCPVCGMYMCDAPSCDLPFQIPCPYHDDSVLPHTRTQRREYCNDTDATGTDFFLGFTGNA